MDPSELMRTYKIGLPDDVDLVEVLWHNMIVYVDKKLKKLVSIQMDGIKDGVQMNRRLDNANDIKFITAVLPGVIAISYKTM
jgi:hypothetical protein